MKYIISFLILSCFFSCTGGKKQDISALHVVEATGSVKITDLFEDFEYIPLETTDESFFGNINKLMVYNDQFYVLDRTITKKIYVFNSDGTFSHAIGTVGGGPGEYTKIEDFTINSKEGQVIVLSYPSIIYKYDLEGKFLESKKIGESLFWNICNTDNGYVCSTNHQTYTSGDEAYQLFLFDRDFQLQEKLLPVLPIQVVIPPFVSNPLINIGKEVVYFDCFTPAMHFLSLGNSRELQSLPIELNGAVPPEVFGNVQSFFSKQNEYCFFNESYYANNLLVSFIVMKGRPCVFIKDFNSGYERSSYYEGRMPKLLTYDEGTFYSSIEPRHILSDDESFKVAGTDKDVEEESNKGIVKFRMKAAKP